jgi:hypothetical protein
VSASADQIIARHAAEIVSADASGGPSTSQTIMVSSLQQLMLRLPSDATPGAYRAAVMEENSLGKATASGREWAFRQLRRYYAFDPSVLIFRALRDLWDHDPMGQPLMALLCAVSRDQVLRSTSSLIQATEVGATLNRTDFEDAIEAAFPGSYRDNTRRTAGGNIASSWTQSGHLRYEGRSGKVRVRACCTPAPVAYALMLGYLQGHRGQALFETVWARTLDRPASQLVELAATGSQVGMLEFRHAGGVMEIGFDHLLRPFAYELGAVE